MKIRTIVYGLCYLSASLILCQCSEDGETVDSSVRSSSALFGKCDHRTHPDPTNRQCREWTGSGFADADLEVSCDGIVNGIYAEGFCPLGNLVGVCVLNAGKFLETKFYYYSDDWDEASAEESCNKKDLTEVTGNTSSTWLSESQ